MDDLDFVRVFYFYVFPVFFPHDFLVQLDGDAFVRH